VLGKTVFGRVWILRFCLVISLSALLLAISRQSLTDASRILRLAPSSSRRIWARWRGQGTQPPDRAGSNHPDRFRRGAPACAVRGWSALPGLAFLLVYTQSRAAAVNATRRFSMLGVISVVALVLTGLVNTWYLVDNVPALLGTDYGWLLLAKVALFAMMLILAATNRWRLTPRLATEEHPARRLLLRNALLETAVGIVVVIVVGSLGIMVPAAHQAPVWPSITRWRWAVFLHTRYWTVVRCYSPSH
jgi:putative copper resistance protein D